jgi:hypothetical protein
MQEPSREVHGFHRCMLQRELLVVDEFGTSLGQTFVFLRTIEDEWDRGFWPQDLARMRFIGHHPDAAMGLAGGGAGGM